VVSTTTFTISTTKINIANTVTKSDTHNNVTTSESLTLDPLTHATLTFDSTTLTGGNIANATVALSQPAPSGGAVVAIVSSNPAAASVPGSVLVAAGATTASVAVSTYPSCATATATISATYGGVAKSSLFTITPIPSDVVVIQRADYFRNRQLLRVSAAGSISTATLQSFVTSSGVLIGSLTNDGGGAFSGEFLWPLNPQDITIRSSHCGSASKGMSLK